MSSSLLARSPVVLSRDRVTLPSNGGATIAMSEPMNEGSGGVASFAKQESGATVPDANKPVIAIAGSHYRDASGFYRINLAVHNADQAPPAPPGFRVVWHN